MVQIQESELIQAAKQGNSEFIKLFTSKYFDVIGGSLTAQSMPLLTGEQHTLLAYQIFHNEISTGGFCQLIQNGYGAYIFDNPFARVMRLWGAEQFSKLIYKAKKIYDTNKEDLERERSDEEFMAMYEQYPAFDELEEQYLFNEDEISSTLAHYIDDNITDFAQVL